MRREEVIGKWAAIVGVLFVASACSAQCGPTARTPVQTTPVAAIPSPSPTPTAPLQASSPPFHGGEVGLAYSPVALSAHGGAAPYTWTVSNGALPGGLTLGSDGSVSGTPTGAGTFTFSVQVADAGNSTASIPATISIAPALSVGLIAACAQYCKVELGCVSVCGGFGQMSGGVAPYSFAVTQGPLPAGTSLSGLSLAGTFKGLSGYLKFGVQVTDALGAVGSVAPIFWMYDHISLAGGTCGPSRSTCSVALAYSGGIPGTQLTAAPTGWVGANCVAGAVIPCPEPTFSASYQPGSVLLKLTYDPKYQATFGTLTVQLTTTDPCGSASKCSASASVNVAG
ncbi:MAG TPA: Ig domain-containing protein [Candidatus Dormibacteraeota bacterium]|nr:Ig domain-containing protein [Candidatus Dormibacteraeota bacterium]